MSKIKERVSNIEGAVPHLAEKSELKDVEVRLTRMVYGLGFLVVLTLLGILGSKVF